MTNAPIRLSRLYRLFQKLPGFVREVLIAIAILAVVVPPYKMLIDVHFMSKQEQLNSLSTADLMAEIFGQGTSFKH